VSVLDCSQNPDPYPNALADRVRQYHFPQVK
jgi:hypothetical protein